jgi:arylsulfatase A-like enzyme
LRGTLKINQVDVAWLEQSFELHAAVVTAGLLFMVMPARVAQWVSATASRVRWVSTGLTIALFGLLGYSMVESLHRGSTGPVQLPEADHSRPNVIIIVLDGLTTLDMSLYGYGLPTTPRLDEITRTWTVFENAHSTATATTAVLPTILTGRYPFTDNWRQYGDLARMGKGLLSLPRIMQARGYETIYSMGGGWPPSRYHLHTAFDRIIGGGYPAFFREHYLVHSFPGRDLVNRTVWNPSVADALLEQEPARPVAPVTSFDEPMYDTVANLFREQARIEDTTPFFLYLHTMRPHPPYLANEFLGTFLPADEGMADTRNQNPLIHQHYDPHNPDDQQAIDKLRLRYDESILKADQQLGQLVDTLKQLELYDESMIMITAVGFRAISRPTSCQPNTGSRCWSSFRARRRGSASTAR